MTYDEFNHVKKNEDDLLYYLTESHRLVSTKLTKAMQKELGLNQS